MSQKKKSQKNAQKAQYKKYTDQSSRGERLANSFQKYANTIGIRNKYKERIKTSYLSLLGYFALIAVFATLREEFMKLEAPNVNALPIMLALPLAGICIAIYNIVKSSLSIKDKESKIHNIVLIVLHSIFILFFIACYCV